MDAVRLAGAATAGGGRRRPAPTSRMTDLVFPRYRVNHRSPRIPRPPPNPPTPTPRPCTWAAGSPARGHLERRRHPRRGDRHRGVGREDPVPRRRQNLGGELHAHERELGLRALRHEDARPRFRPALLRRRGGRGRGAAVGLGGLRGDSRLFFRSRLGFATLHEHPRAVVHEAGLRHRHRVDIDAGAGLDGIDGQAATLTRSWRPRARRSLCPFP